MLGAIPSRVVPRAMASANLPDALLYTDAEGSGGVGACVFFCDTQKWEYAASSVPRKWRKPLRKRATQINAFEMLAMLAAWHTWKRELRGRRVICFLDNTAGLNIASRAGHQSST